MGLIKTVKSRGSISIDGIGLQNVSEPFELLRHDKDLWDLFTRKEEYGAPIHDCYDRFPFYMSENNCAFDPRVSKFFIENNVNFEYPDNKKFAVCLTHDIDFINATKLNLISDTAKFIHHRELGTALRRPFIKVNKKWNPYINFETTMDLEEVYGAKSSFYFLSLDKGDQDFNYNLEYLSNEMGSIIDRGFEVGLQGSHRALYSLEVLKHEKKRLENILGQEVIGYRNHYLRFRVPETWELLKQAGFKYDTTFGYPNCVGFRNGMCHPFKPFNRNTNLYIEILEIPLIIMDGTLFNHMKLDLLGSWEVMKRIIDVVASCNGVVTILFHNFYLRGEYLELYEKTLKYCQDKNAFFASAECIYRWWEKDGYEQYREGTR